MVRILLILGDQSNIIEPITEQEIKTCFTTPNLLAPKLVPLIQPSIEDFFGKIHNESFDIIIIVGHSHQNEDGSDGNIWINRSDRISINNFSQPFVESVRKGLKLVILAGCSSIGAGRALASNDIEVPNVIVFREPVHYRVLRQFFKLLKSYWIDNSLSLERAVTLIKPNLSIFNKECPGASNILNLLWPIKQDPLIPPLMFSDFTRLEKSLPLWRKLFNKLLVEVRELKKYLKLLIFLVVGLIIALLIYLLNPNRPITDIQESIGNRVLFTNQLPNRLPPNYVTNKESVASLFRQGNKYPQVIENANRLRSDFDDPEPIWTSNNAQVLKDETDRSKIVTIPLITSNNEGYSTARESPRGAVIFQMQNNQTGTHNKKLKILVRIISDNNGHERNNESEKGALAKKVANMLAKEIPKPIAVMGHFESDASKAAAPIYANNKIVMISPASSVTDLFENTNGFIFRTVPTSDKMAKELADYIKNDEKKERIGFCSDGSLDAAIAFKKAFEKASEGNFMLISPDKCNVPYFDWNTDPAQIIDGMTNVQNQQIQGLVLYFHLNKPEQIREATALADAAKRRGIKLYGSHSLDAEEVKKAGESFQGMDIVTPRNGEYSKEFINKFLEIYKEYEPTWRDSMAYDAMKAIAFGLDNSDGTAEGIRKVLHNPDPTFCINGSSGPIKFSENGDRSVTPSIARLTLVKNKYIFKLVPSRMKNTNPNESRQNSQKKEVITCKD